jgi:hypothetical protein
MGVVRDKLDYLSGTKRLLREGINAVLADRGDPLLTESTPFEDYPSALWAQSPAASVGSLTGPVADKLLRLNETKNRLREAINAELGAGLTAGDAFRAYGERIWSPRALFLNGEQGAWYDPSDLTTLYQDAAGTTPVTADGDPVGLMLDKSQGLVLGPEMVQSIPEPRIQDYEGSSGQWNSVTNTASNAAVSTSVHYPRFRFLFPDIDETKTYKLSITLSGEVDKISLLPVYGPGLVSTDISNQSGPTYTYTGKLSASSLNLGIFTDGRAVWDGITVDSVSIRELKGNHAVQSVAARRPIYRTDGILHWLEFDGVDDRLDTADLAFLSGTNTSHIFVAGRLVSRTQNAGLFSVAADSTAQLSQRSLADSGGNPGQMKVDVRGGSHTFAATATEIGSYEALFESGTIIGGGVNLDAYTDVARSHSTANGVMSIGVGLAAKTPNEFYGMILRDRETLGADRESAMRFNARLGGITL